MASPILCGVHVRVCSAALLASLIAYAGCAPVAVPAPTAFVQFQSKDGVVQCEYPQGWEITASGGRGPVSHSVFVMGGAKIDIKCDLAGSILGDLSRVPDPDAEPPAAKVHELAREMIVRENPEYKEEEPTKVTGRLGEGRQSEFTLPGAFGAVQRGYRATFLTRDRRVEITCSCPESDWETLKPAFTRVIGTLAPAPMQ